MARENFVQKVHSIDVTMETILNEIRQKIETILMLRFGAEIKSAKNISQARFVWLLYSNVESVNSLVFLAFETIISYDDESKLY